MDLTFQLNCRTLYSNTSECTFFSAAHGTFSKIVNIIGTNQNITNVGKLKWFLIAHVTEEFYKTKLEVHMEKNNRTYIKSWILPNILLNNKWVIEKNQE